MEFSHNSEDNTVSSAKASNNQDLLDRCLSIRKILFETENQPQGRFTFQDRITQAKSKLEVIEKQERPPLKLISTTTQGLPSLGEVIAFQKSISECPDEKFNALSQDYLKSLLELASIINYRMKTC